MRKLLLCLLVAGCGKTEAPSPSSSPASPQSRMAAARPAPAPAAAPAVPKLELAIGGDKASLPSLPFTISKVYAKRKPLDRAPWHADGGDWIFFDAEAGGGRFTVGSFARAFKDPALAGFGGFGEAIIAVSSAEDGARVSAAFARRFHVALPPPGARGPVTALRFSTAVLGDGVARAPEGGFGGSGSWTASKWFLDGGSAEIFFNFSVADLRGEFTQKDADYNEDAAAAFARGLRDGTPALKKN